MKRILMTAAIMALAATTTPALADGKINCGGGPRTGWTPVGKLTEKLIKEGWTIKKAKMVRDCYEVYGKTPQGDNVESFFHPVTLATVLILKRGKTLYRAPGY